MLLLALICPRWSQAEELVPALLAFDPPAFLSGSVSGPGNPAVAGGSREVRRYAAADNDPRTSQRLLIVSVRETGAAVDALRAEMQAAMNALRNATNVSQVTDAEVGGQAALLASYQVPRPYWQKPDGVFFPYEVYWVRVQTNQVVEIKLIADSPEHLATLKACLPQFKITKTAAATATKSTAVAP